VIIAVKAVRTRSPDAGAELDATTARANATVTA
jgi:hypothetical protein